MNPTCATCKFAMANPEDLKQIICRRFPPQLAPTRDGTFPIFPTLLKDKGWCGEYQLKLELTS